MKHLSIFLLAASLLFTIQAVAQNKTARYIQINGVADIMGNIRLSQVEAYNKIQNDSTSQLSKLVNNIIGKSKNAIEAINLLAAEGWSLISVVAIPKDENGRPNSPFIAYYFKKE